MTEASVIEDPRPAGERNEEPVRRLQLEDRIADQLPSIVRTELARMDAGQQAQFAEEFRRKRKSKAIAYLASLLYLHYAYVGRVGMTLLMWLVAICTLGILGLIWWFVDLFRIPGIVGAANRDIATAILRDMKIISGR